MCIRAVSQVPINQLCCYKADSPRQSWVPVQPPQFPPKQSSFPLHFTSLTPPPLSHRIIYILPFSKLKDSLPSRVFVESTSAKIFLNFRSQKVYISLYQKVFFFNFFFPHHQALNKARERTIPNLFCLPTTNSQSHLFHQPNKTISSSIHLLQPTSKTFKPNHPDLKKSISNGSHNWCKYYRRQIWPWSQEEANHPN